MATLTLNGVRSIGEATIDLTGPITLLAGDNGEGKTSALLALKAILTGSTACISTKQKDDADGMCADGMTKRASAMLADDDGQAVASWSKSKCYPVKTVRSVAGLPRASKAAATDFLSMSAQERAAAFLEAFQIEPTLDDLTSGLVQAQLDVPTAEIWNDIQIHQWDGVYQQAQEKLTELKSSWKAVTNEQWTEERGADWTPDCIDETGMTEQKLGQLQQNTITTEEAAAKARAEREAIVVPPEPGEELKCPHCAKAVQMRAGGLVKFEPVDDAERQRLMSMRNALSGKVAGLEEDARKATALFGAALEMSKLAEENREDRVARASSINDEITKQETLVGVLGPEGVRGVKRDRLLHLLNGELEEMGNVIGLEGVNIVWGPEPGKKIPTICALMGNRLYQNLARSEQWRVRLLVQLLIAKRDGSTMVLLDDCEILTRQRRAPLIKLLTSTGINVVAAMSISDGVNNAPDLAGASLGQTYWVEGGKILPLADAKAAVMQTAA